jgi:accessory gene regulator protein AgrB
MDPNRSSQYRIAVLGAAGLCFVLAMLLLTVLLHLTEHVRRGAFGAFVWIAVVCLLLTSAAFIALEYGRRARPSKM